MVNAEVGRVNLATDIVGKLRHLIADESLSAGDRFPSESEICNRFSVSRSTAREALKVLERDGVVVAIKGRGRFVANSAAIAVVSPVTEYQSITEMLESLGYEITDSVLQVDESPATAEQAEALQIEQGEVVINLIRLRLTKNEPVVLCVGTILREAFPGPIRFRDWRGSVVAALDANGYPIRSAAARIRAVPLPERYVDDYNLGGYGPWLLTEEICVTDEGRRVMYALDYHRGDLFSLDVLRRR